MENTIKKQKSFFQRIAEIFFTIYLITLYLFVDKGETIIISQVAFIIFAGLTALVILLRQRIHLGKNVMIVYLTFTWLFATYFWAYNEYLAYLKIRTIWQLFILFFLTYNLFCEEEDSHEYLLKSLYIAGIAMIGYSIYTYGIGYTLDVLKNAATSHTRLGSEINQANTFGMMNATTCIVAFYYLFYRKRFKLFHIVILVLAFLFAMSSGSRKALLMMCIGILFLVYKRYGIRQIYKLVAIVTVLIITFIVIIQLPMFEFISERVEQTVEVVLGTGKGDNSSKLRINMIKDGWDIFKKRILTGYGADNYRLLTRYRTYSHNNFIEILVDFGLVGFILYYLIYWNSLKNLWKTGSDAGKALLTIFLVRFLMEIAVVNYYEKVHWVLMAFFLINPQKSKAKLEGESKNENILKKIEESSI